jgi:aerobic carbon-monoxide dehydrogenase large subunit
MSVVGIGVAVRRKEDFRFVTGRGQYTDDINRPGQCYIHFVRSAAVMNAITDAVGTEDIAMPATAPVVWAAIQKVNAARKAAE